MSSTVINSVFADNISESVEQFSPSKKIPDLAQQLLESIFDTSTDAVVGVDSQGYIRYWNQRCESLLDSPMNSTASKHCSDLFSNSNCECPGGCKNQCCINQSPDMSSSDRSEFNATLQLNQENPQAVTVGSLFLPQQKTDAASLFFTIRKATTGNNKIQQKESLPGQNPLDRLTRRQEKILSLAAEGMNTSEIAEHLSISLETVRNHFKHIYPKLGVHSRAEAVSLVLRSRHN